MAASRHGRTGAPGAPWWLLGLLLGLVAAPAAAKEPRGSAAGESHAATTGLSDACRESVARELQTGEIAALDRCDAERQEAQRRRLRTGRSRVSFGLVERARASVTRVRLVVSEARGCARWPLRLPGHPVLGLYEVKAARCWVRRYSGELTLDAVLPDGRRVAGVFVARADRDGQVELDLMHVDASVRRRGQPGLDAYVRLELGAGGWAGSVDLAAIRGLIADQHAGWVQRGRGVPALMVVRYPTHASADKIRGLALEATLRRQESDYQAVVRGELTPRRFRERHPWSPFRRRIAEADE